MYHWLKKLDRSLNEKDHSCYTITSICSVISIFLLLPLTYTWLISEITMPIRCALAEDDKVYIPMEEWKQQRNFQSEDLELSRTDYFYLTPSEKEQAPEFITLDNQTYEFSRGNLKSGVVVYEREKNYFNIFMTNYWIIYDTVLHKIISSGEEVYNKYSVFLLPEYSTCNRESD
ncbi:hypothetical protein [Gallibacterium anatis]|uniref:hypothetical protein n=1 Tax=Gallibacterium anatis TaxID=750 RepID=UPI0008025F83|nr:hypothetical protein [Gallibacterium anatis]OBW95831.1 hypothetical protein QV02_04890 [Gallibacterium anatis]